MGSSEKFCLRWNDFESNISKAFREIREDKDFFDVTLACDDDDQISAHKVILSACSPFFRGVLKRNRHDHPLLYLKGVKYTDLAAVLNFMYHGEVNVAQEDLNTFLSVAEDLKVKGLTQSDSSSSDSSRKDAASAASSNDSNSSRSSNLKSKSRDSPAAAREPPSKKSRPNPPSLTPAPHLTQHNNDDIQEVTPVKTEAIMISQDASGGGGVDGGGGDGGAASLAVEEYNTELVDADYVEDFGDYEAGYDGEAGYDTSIVEDPTHADGNKGGGGVDDGGEAAGVYMELMTGQKDTWRCRFCAKVIRRKSRMLDHIESHHLFDGPSHPCSFCNKLYSTKNSRDKHISTYHKENVFNGNRKK